MSKSVARPVEFEGISHPLWVRVSLRARRVSLKVNPQGRRIELVLPRGMSVDRARAFVSRSRSWIARHSLHLSAPAPALMSGSPISVLGRPLEVVHDPAHRGQGVLSETCIRVGGDLAFFARRVRDTLKTLALREFSARAAQKAELVCKKIRSVQVRDMRSRWGSCSTSGRLSFCWRLVMAPDHVVDYIVAHEVAHLVEMNHSRAFWTVVDRLTPHRREAAKWLKAHGLVLHHTI
ncbi:MAG: M48 family metallopeptidase [Pseudomonadota bacterium]|nr:M48 family metallopeptidase [Pseudomonadota bacterium]